MAKEKIKETVKTLKRKEAELKKES